MTEYADLNPISFCPKAYIEKILRTEKIPFTNDGTAIHIRPRIPIKRGLEITNEDLSNFLIDGLGIHKEDLLEKYSLSVDTFNKTRQWRVPERITRQTSSIGSEIYFEDRHFLPTDLANEIMDDYHFITLSDTHEIYYYDNGVYVSGGEVLIKKECLNRLKDETRRQRTREVEHYIQCKTYRKRDEFDAQATYINLKNGFFDLETWTLKPHSPDELFMRQLPVIYDPAAECPAIQKFFSEVVSPEDVISLKEIGGFCLMPDYKIQKAIMLQGEGSNGKSTYLNLLSVFIGTRNISGKTLRDLVNNRFSAASLYGKYANIVADLPSVELASTGQFKALTGGDYVSAEKKFKDSFEFMNKAKLIFSANELPKTRDYSKAFYRRWFIVIFPFCFEGTQKNPNLINELTTPQELSGLLNLALESLKQLIKQEDFSRAETTEEIARKYERLSNPVSAFLEDCCIIDPAEGISIPKQALYTAFKRYVQENKLPPLADTAFFKEIKQNPHIGEGRLTIDKERVYCFLGIKLNEESQNKHIIQKILDKLDTIDTKNNQLIDKNIDTLDTIDKSNLSAYSVQDVYPFSHFSESEHSEERQIRDLIIARVKADTEHKGDTSREEMKELGASDNLIDRLRASGTIHEYKKDHFWYSGGAL